MFQPPSGVVVKESLAIELELCLGEECIMTLPKPTTERRHDG